MNLLDKRSIETHISVVGWLQILNSAITFLIAAFVVVVVLTIASLPGDSIAARFLATTGWLTGGLLAALALPGLIAGIGVLKRDNWARVMAIVVGILQIPLFPIGTVLGAYTLFVLVQRQAEEAFGCCIPEAPLAQGASA